MDFGEVGFASLALAMALNLPPLAVSIPIVIFASIVIMLISQKKGEKGDVTIALVASGALAIGVIITAFTSGFGADSYNYMFGSILAMTTKDVILSIVLTLLSLGIYIVFYNRLFFITFDEKFAKASGINVTLYEFLISLLTAFIVVIGMRMMGTIIARKTTVSFKGLVIKSGIISVICFLLGMLLSFFLDMPTGAAIVAVYIVLMLITNLSVKIVKI